MALINEESRLLEQLKLGNEKAVTTWFRLYNTRLHRFIAARVAVREDVDELVQEVFLACLRELVHFKGESSLSTWMLTIAKHKVADFYRARYAKKVIHLVALLDEMGSAVMPFSQDHVVAVQETLSRLNPDFQEVLLGKYVDGKSVQQLAQECSRTSKAIESLLFRARHAFRAEYLVVTTT